MRKSLARKELNKVKEQRNISKKGRRHLKDVNTKEAVLKPKTTTQEQTEKVG